MLSLHSLSLLLLGFGSLAAAGSCDTVRSKYPSIQIGQKLSAAYRNEQKEYWNKGAGQLPAACVIFPKTAQEVSQVLGAIHENNDQFAVKGGGHNPNKNVSSVANGPVIALSGMKQLLYDNATQSVAVGPGNRWQDVAAYTGNFGRVIVSGRMGHVGVPGLLLGGGMSFLSTQYGWASTHVLEYEIVLANGTITTASPTKNPDLHRALQGGGNAFGVVTKFTLRTFPVGKIWGGYRAYLPSHIPELIKGVHDFSNNYPDEKAAMILTTETTLSGLLDLAVMFYFYNGPEVPDNVFANFTKIPHVISSTKQRSYPDLVFENNMFVLNGSNYAIFTETTPVANTPTSLEHIREVHKHWEGIGTSTARRITGTVASMAFQPVPRHFSRASQKYGGNVVDMGDDGDRIVFEFNISWLNNFASNEAIVDKAARDIYEGIDKIIKKNVAAKKIPDIPTPLFLNDAYYAQDYFGRHKEKALFQKVKSEVDPDTFFGKRTQTWPLVGI